MGQVASWPHGKLIRTYLHGRPEQRGLEQSILTLVAQVKLNGAHSVEMRTENKLVASESGNQRASRKNYNDILDDKRNAYYKKRGKRPRGRISERRKRSKNDSFVWTDDMKNRLAALFKPSIVDTSHDAAAVYAVTQPYEMSIPMTNNSELDAVSVGGQASILKKPCTRCNGRTRRESFDHYNRGSGWRRVTRITCDERKRRHIPETGTFKVGPCGWFEEIESIAIEKNDIDNQVANQVAIDRVAIGDMLGSALEPSQNHSQVYSQDMHSVSVENNKSVISDDVSSSFEKDMSVDYVKNKSTNERCKGKESNFKLEYFTKVCQREECKKTYEGINTQRFCSHECRSAHQKRVTAARRARGRAALNNMSQDGLDTIMDHFTIIQPAREKPCESEGCTRTFIGRNGDRYCSDPCRQLVQRKQDREYQRRRREKQLAGTSSSSSSSSTHVSKKHAHVREANMTHVSKKHAHVREANMTHVLKKNVPVRFADTTHDSNDSSNDSNKSRKPRAAASKSTLMAAPPLVRPNAQTATSSSVANLTQGADHSNIMTNIMSITRMKEEARMSSIDTPDNEHGLRKPDRAVLAGTSQVGEAVLPLTVPNVGNCHATIVDMPHWIAEAPSASRQRLASLVESVSALRLTDMARLPADVAKAVTELSLLVV